MSAKHCVRCVALRSIEMTCGSSRAAIAAAKVTKAAHMNRKCGTDRFARERTEERTRLLNCVIDNDHACVKSILLRDTEGAIDIKRHARKAAVSVLDAAAVRAGTVMTVLVIVTFFRLMP